MNIDIDTVEVVAVLLLAQAAYRVKERPRNCSQYQKDNIDFNRKTKMGNNYKWRH